MTGHWLMQDKLVLVTAVTWLRSLCLSSFSKLGWGRPHGDGRGEHVTSRLHTGLPSLLPHSVGQSKADGSARGHRARKQRPLILALKDKKEEFTEGVHSVVDQVERGVQGDRTWYVRHGGVAPNPWNRCYHVRRKGPGMCLMRGGWGFSKLLQNLHITHFRRLTNLDSVLLCVVLCLMLAPKK